MAETADNVQPEWVRETRKRLRHEQLLQQEDEAGQVARTKEKERQLEDELRASYPHYDRDLKGIQRSIEGAVPLLKVGETCWVFLHDTCADIRIYGHLQQVAKDGTTTFRSIFSWQWSCLAVEDGPASGPRPVVLAVMANDLVAWARSVGLVAKAQQCGRGTVGMPFSSLFNPTIYVPESEYYVRTVCIGVPL